MIFDTFNRRKTYQNSAILRGEGVQKTCHVDAFFKLPLFDQSQRSLTIVAQVGLPALDSTGKFPSNGSLLSQVITQ